MTSVPGSPTPERAPLFTPSLVPRSPGSLLPWGIAGIAVLLIAGGIVFFSHRTAKTGAETLQPLDAYASQLSFGAIVMSESTSLSGGKSTFIDGHVRNTGSRTVTGASLQVLFGNFDPSQPPQIESVPLSLIRTHEPYIDTESVASDPLVPGADKEFRLIFEDISPNWNQQLPEIHAVNVSLKSW